MQSLISTTLIQLAFEEDIGSGDITTQALISPNEMGEAKIIAKQDMIIAGLKLITFVYDYVGFKPHVQHECTDGDKISKGQTVTKISGTLAPLFETERIVLNFLQRLSGIATMTNAYVKVIGNRPKPIIVDTRKTLPGWRRLEKMAVRIGGGKNHRMGLYDAMLIKDNHIQICDGVIPAINLARKHASHLTKIEIEVENFEQLDQALSAKVDVIMLDNMSITDIQKAVKIVNGKALVEVSGGITIEKVAELVDSGVDIISVGALTHSAKAVDLSMEINKV